MHTINGLYADRDRFIEIAAAAGEQLSEEDMDALIGMSVQLEHLSRSVDSLKLWLRKKMEK